MNRLSRIMNHKTAQLPLFLAALRWLVLALLPLLLLAPLASSAAKTTKKSGKSRNYPAAKTPDVVFTKFAKSADGNFEVYNIIDERNIFSPDRQRAARVVAVERPADRAKPRTTITVTGTMLKEDKSLVFLQSVDARYNGAFSVKKRIDAYTIEDINLKQVVLQGVAPDALPLGEGPNEGTGEGISVVPEPPKRLEVPIGSMMQCDDLGNWRVSAVVYAPPPSYPSYSTPSGSSPPGSYSGGYNRGGPGYGPSGAAPGNYGATGSYYGRGYPPSAGMPGAPAIPGAPNAPGLGMSGVPAYPTMPGMPAYGAEVTPGMMPGTPGMPAPGIPGTAGTTLPQPGTSAAPGVPAPSAPAAPAASPDEILKRMMERRNAGQ